MDKTERNKRILAIASFDGWVETDRAHPYEPGLGNLYIKDAVFGRSWIDKFRYDSDWKELMPVVDKIVREGAKIKMRADICSLSSPICVSIENTGNLLESMFIVVSNYCLAWCEINKIKL